MEMNNGKNYVLLSLLLSLNKTEVSMSLCFAHAGNIYAHALSFVVHFSIKRRFLKEKNDQRIAMHISENMKELYFNVTFWVGFVWRHCIENPVYK